MKKRILTVALVIALLAVCFAGTYAYLMDDDAQKNTFTVGNVAIDLWEDFGENDGIEKLLPAVGSAQYPAGNDQYPPFKNYVTKEVFVTNTGSEDAYVRVHIAIPSILDDAQPNFDASKNVLHFNWLTGTNVDGKWNWNKKVDGTGGWNYYKTTIGDVEYNVYVVTYETALTKDAETESAIHQVYLDSKTSNEDIDRINEVLGEEWHIYVVAEGVQAEGFADAYVALNTAFGEPGTYTVDFEATAENQTFVDND